MSYSTLATFYFIVNFSCFVVATDGSKIPRILCPPGFIEDENVENENNLMCYGLLPNKDSWENAQRSCMKSFSFLLDIEFFNTTFLQDSLKVNGVDEIWIDIRRVAGFYAWRTFNPRIFKEIRKWGTKWQKGDTLSEDCVALNVASGTLTTKNCSEELSYLCVNGGFSTQPVQLPLCPENWIFTYHMDVDSDRCVRIFPRSTYEEANATCWNNSAQLISEKDYDGLYNVLQDKFLPSEDTEAYWMNLELEPNGKIKTRTAPSMKNVKWKAYDNTEKLPVICKQPVKAIEAVARIYPEELNSFPSTENRDLTCKVIINENITDELLTKEISYRWKKNGFPLSEHKEKTIYPELVEDETKQQYNLFNQQGSYQCQVLIAGLIDYVTSQEVEIYFSDVSTYVITLESQESGYSSLQDLSRSGFQTVWEPVEEGMKKTVESFSNYLPQFKISKKLESVQWGFQNISISNTWMKIKLLFYVQWSKDNNRQEPNESSNQAPENLVEEYLKEKCNTNLNNSVFRRKMDSFSINRADVCLQEWKDGLNWLQTYETKTSISNHLCLNEFSMLKRRVCHKDLNNGAHWQKDPIRCEKTQDLFDQENLTTCPDGYKLLIEDYCYKTESELPWNEAFAACSKDYAYLYSDDFDFNWYENASKILESLDGLGEFWAGGRKFNGIFQWIGMAPRVMTENNRLKWAANEPNISLDCVSVSAKKNSAITAWSKNCTESKKFVCTQRSMELSEIPSCDGNWVGSIHYDKCFLLVKEKKTWKEAQDHCKRYHPTSHLLTLPTKTVYSLILKWIKDNHHYDESDNWWFGLKRIREKYEWQGTAQSELNFVDWSRDTEFTGKNSVGALTIETINGKEYMKWNLFPPSIKNAFICEKEKHRNVGSASADIKMSRITESNPKSNYSCSLKNSLRSNVVWYKDGIPVEGKQGMIWNNKLCPECIASESSDPKEIFRSQGYYSCSTEQEKPFKRVISLPLLHQIKGVQTFVVTMLSTNKFTKHYQNMTKGTFLHSASKLEKELEDILEPEFSVIMKNISINKQGSELLLHFYHTQRKNKPEIQNEKFNKEFIENIFKGICSGKLCSNIKKWLDLNDIKKESTEVKNTACLKDVTITSMNVTLTWPRTTVGESSIPQEDCLIDGGRSITRRCLGNFNTGAYWDEVRGNCREDLTLENVAQAVITEDNVVESTVTISTLSSPRRNLNATDVILIAEILSNIANVTVTNTTVIEESAKVIDNLLLGRRDALDEAQNQNNSLNSVTDSLEKILLNSEIKEKNITIAHSTIVVQALDLPDFSGDLPVGITATRSADSTLSAANIYNGSYLSAAGVTAGIALPVDLVENRSLTGGLKFIIYQDPLLFQYKGRLYDNIVINGPIIFAHIGSEPVRGLKEPIQMIMEAHNVSLMNEKRTYCSYLVETEHRWSGEGCSFVESKDNRYLCYCDHLTHFAVLTDVNDEDFLHEDHEFSLTIITYIGCSLSIVGLTLTILTFAFFRKSRKGNKQQTLCNLSVALLIVMFLFMFGINRNEPKLGCLIIAASLHYFLLAAFCWMLVEAVLQYLNFVKVLSTYIPRFMRKAMIFAWGFPAVIVTTVLSIDYEQYDSGKKYCWISREGFNFAFVLPVVSLLIINFVVFGLIIFGICKPPPPGLQINQSTRRLAITRLRAAICISFLLGLSWLFGFLAINEAKLVLQYLFAITTTIQGFFIFIFSVAQDNASRQLWYSLFFKPRSIGHPHTTQTSDNISLTGQGRRIKFIS